MNVLLILLLIAAGLFLLCLEFTVCLIVSSIYKRREKLGVRSVKEATECLLKQDIKPWEVDT